QRGRAEQNLAAATETSNGLIFDLAVRFRDQRGVPAALVKDIIDRARKLQQQLTGSGQVTPDLQRSEAAALHEVGATRLAIGDTAGAFSAVERSQQIIAALVARNPDDTGWQRDLAVGYLAMGEVLHAAGKREEALAAYRQGLAAVQKLVARDQRNSVWQR